MLVPSTVVAEIVPFDRAEPVEDGPEWLWGDVVWRGLSIPALSLAPLLGRPDTPAHAERRHMAVFNTLGGNPALPFYAVVIGGIPHMVQAGADSVTAIDDDSSGGGLALRHVRVQGQRAMIPDLDRIEAMLLETQADLALASED